MPSASSASSLSAIQSSESASMVFIATSGPDTDCDEPTARNSKRLPVKANGEVRLRSPGSRRERQDLRQAEVHHAGLGELGRRCPP